MSYETALCVQRLKALAQKHGFLTYAQIDAELPLPFVDPVQITAIVEQLERSGIRVAPDSSIDGN